MQLVQPIILHPTLEKAIKQSKKLENNKDIACKALPVSASTKTLSKVTYL